MTLDNIKIRKGDFLSNKHLEKRLGKKPDPFDLMALQHAIQSEHRVTVRVEDGGLRVLSDLEASEYNNRHFGLLLRRLYHRHRLQQRVDHSEFKPDELRTHDRRIEVQSKVLQGVEQTLREALPKEVAPSSSKAFEKELPKLFY